MSLRVWLPLNGDLRNNGLSNYNLSMFRGSETYSDSGKLGKCFYSNGVNTIKILNIIPDFYNYTSYSICAWACVEARNASHTGSAIISSGNWNGQVINMAMSSWSSDHYTQLRVSGTNWLQAYSYNFNVNTWYHIVVTCDGFKTRAYVNGVLIGDTAPAFMPSSIEGNDIAIGGATYYGGMQFFGKINDVRIYDHALSPKEIKLLSQGLVCHYQLSESLNNENIVYDCSGYNNHMTAVNEPTMSTNTIRNMLSTHFINGQYAAAQQNANTYLPKDSLTVNIWIYCTTWGNPISCTEGGGWNFENSNGLQFPCYISGVGYKVVKSGVAISSLLNAWHMLTGTFDGTQVKIYIDGELKATTATGSTNGIGYASNRLIISGEAQSATPHSSAFVGEISDVRIYATGLSEEDIQNLYNAPVSITNTGTMITQGEFVEVAT